MHGLEFSVTNENCSVLCGLKSILVDFLVQPLFTEPCLSRCNNPSSDFRSLSDFRTLCVCEKDQQEQYRVSCTESGITIGGDEMAFDGVNPFQRKTGTFNFDISLAHHELVFRHWRLVGFQELITATTHG
jgi:hypothetical protein